jgi:ADP-L-glycero-D-manno-heptose 6-epimerase
MILITGAAGFIGSVLAATLNRHGRSDLVLVDRLDESSKWLNLRSLAYAEYIEADELFSCEASKLDTVDFIFHLGACSSTTEKNMRFLMSNNVDCSKRLFEFARLKEIPIVYASSAATYGDGEQGYSDDHGLSAKLRPLNPYGYSKQVFDQWVLNQERKPAHWFGLKFFNVFGPHEYHKGEMRSLVHKAYEQILATGTVKLFKSHRSDFADGEQLRDFVYVKDVVRVMLEMMNPSARNFSGLYNLGTGQARSFKDLVLATFKAMDREPKIEFIDMPLELRGQYQYFTQANMDKLKLFSPTFEFTSLEAAVSDYVQTHLMGGPYL